jgi:heme exporter protein B
MYKAWLIFKKDIQQEFRTRYAVNAILLFSVVTLTAVSFSVGTFSAGQDLLAALLWIILFFSSMSGLSHIFVKEEETGTADTLKLVATGTQVFLGKFFFNIILLAAVEFITVPLFLAVMNFKIMGIALFLISLLLGSIGLAAGGTMVAAIISKAGAKGALFTVLSFPILLPVIVGGISASRISGSVASIAAGLAEIQMLFAYGVVVITASILLFDFVWNE